jgi:hypothetical protein
MINTALLGCIRGVSNDKANKHATLLLQSACSRNFRVGNAPVGNTPKQSLGLALTSVWPARLVETRFALVPVVARHSCRRQLPLLW